MRSTLLAHRGGRVAAGVLLVLMAAVLIGLVLLWPSGSSAVPGQVAGVSAQQADVERVTRFRCPLSRFEPCQGVDFRLLDGSTKGQRSTLTLAGTDNAPEVKAGDKIRVLSNDPVGGIPGGAPPVAQPGIEAYAFIDFERRSPLLLLTALFAVLVIALARGQGLRSLVGLFLSLVVVTQFLVPAILQGSSPLLVALVGALAVMFLTLALAHGVGVKSMAAALGAAGTLLVTALLAVLFVGLAEITGYSSEEASLLQGNASFQGESLSLDGLVLAGIVVGALGVLDDVTVSQASTVLALQRANPAQTFGRLFREALSVGRDHLSATVNTLVLAYVGAALPILLIFESQGTTFGNAVNRESIAGEIVAMLVGSIGLVMAVPVTTALAAWLGRLVPATALPDEHAHHH